MVEEIEDDIGRIIIRDEKEGSRKNDDMNQDCVKKRKKRTENVNENDLIGFEQMR